MIYVDKKSLKSQIFKLIERKGREYSVVENDSEFDDDKKNLFITSQENTFVHDCPATKIYRCCNYHVVDIMEGCPFDCSYCILQFYLNHKYIKVYDGFDKVKNEIEDLNKKGRYRLGTGELSDSLAMEHVIPLSEIFIPLVNRLDNIQFEFKTKSKNIENLLRHNPKNVVISFSLNPEEISKREEHGAVSPIDRINAAKICGEYGYKLAFHFDPLINYSGFDNGYSTIIDYLLSNIQEHYVEFVSISTFRFVPELLDIVRDKFDNSLLLQSEYIKGLDGKMRYFKGIRADMLNKVVKLLRYGWKNTFLYFCMEHESIWKSIFGYDPGEREEFEKYFKWCRR